MLLFGGIFLSDVTYFFGWDWHTLWRNCLLMFDFFKLAWVFKSLLSYATSSTFLECNSSLKNTFTNNTFWLIKSPSVAILSCQSIHVHISLYLESNWEPSKRSDCSNARSVVPDLTISEFSPVYCLWQSRGLQRKGKETENKVVEEGGRHESFFI